MKLLSIIITVLMASTAATAQTFGTNATPAIAMLEQTRSNSFEMPTDMGEEGHLNITTDKKINAVKVIDEAGDVVISRSARMAKV